MGKILIQLKTVKPRTFKTSPNYMRLALLTTSNALDLSNITEGKFFTLYKQIEGKGCRSWLAVGPVIVSCAVSGVYEGRSLSLSLHGICLHQFHEHRCPFNTESEQRVSQCEPCEIHCIKLFDFDLDQFRLRLLKVNFLIDNVSDVE